MNNDLISRNKLKEDLIKFFPTDCLEGIESKTLFNQILTDIDNAPTIELGEDGIDLEKYSDRLYKIAYEKGKADRPQGEWIRICSLGNGNARYECSNCHYSDEHAESCEVPYCWHCGAKMKGGAEILDDYQRAVEDTEFCERYEPTYNSDDGSM